MFGFLEGAELYLLLGIVLLVGMPIAGIVLLVKWSNRKRDAAIRDRPMNCGLTWLAMYGRVLFRSQMI